MLVYLKIITCVKTSELKTSLSTCKIDRLFDAPPVTKTLQLSPALKLGYQKKKSLRNLLLFTCFEPESFSMNSFGQKLAFNKSSNFRGGLLEGINFLV